jgi:hypothetical protein
MRSWTVRPEMPRTSYTSSYRRGRSGTEKSRNRRSLKTSVSPNDGPISRSDRTISRNDRSVITVTASESDSASAPPTLAPSPSLAPTPPPTQ